MYAHIHPHKTYAYMYVCIHTYTHIHTRQISAARIYEVIDRVPEIDVSSEEGIKPAGVRGDIELRNVSFTYPARLEAPIFDGLNLSIKCVFILYGCRLFVWCA